jgi:hypothetical protein
VLMASVCVYVTLVTVNRLIDFDLDCVWEAYNCRLRRVFEF